MRPRIFLRDRPAHRRCPLRSAPSPSRRRSRAGHTGGIPRDQLHGTEFVGRRAELGALARVIGDARCGLPSVVLLSGEAGMGKTSIVRESAARAGVDLYLARSSHIGGDRIPLAPLVDLLRQIRRTAPEVVEATPILLEWLAAGAGAGAADQAAPHRGLFLAVLDAITRLGDRTGAEGAVLVAFEDLHWADAVTWDLFEYLARNLIDEHVVLVGSHRPDEIAVHRAQRTRLAELTMLPGAHRIHLDGLDRGEVGVRVASLLGRAAPDDLVDRVLARGRGNPFFTNELVAAHVAGERVPMVLSDLISTEIADLDEAARLVLAAVATIGRDATHERLLAVVGLTEPELELALRTAISARLLVVESETYVFRHPLLGEVVYADLLPSQRARLHRSVAEALRHQPAHVLRRADRAGELALHLDRAGDRVGAFEALLAAADAAEAVAPGAAFSHLERAFELWDAVDPSSAACSRSARLWQAAELATSTVGNARAVELAREAFEHGPPPLGAAWGHERLGRYLWAAGRFDESSAEFAHAASLLHGGGGGADAAPVYAGLAQAELMAGRHSVAEGWCTKVFDLVRAPDANPAAWSMAQRVLGIVRSDQGDPSAAVELCRAAVAVSPNAQARALATLYLCVALGDAGDAGGALRTAQDAAADGRLTGLDRGFGCYFDSLAAEALVRLGRWTEVAGVLARQPLADTLAVGLLRLARTHALVAARRGLGDDALDHLAVAHQLPIDGWHEAVRDATAADVHLALGNWDDAARAAERGWAATGGSSVLWAARFAMYGMVAAVEQTLDRRARRTQPDTGSAIDGSRRRLEAATTLAARVPGGPQADTAAHLAHAAASLTRLEAPDVRGADLWAEAVARWEELGDRWAAAVALGREAEVAAGAGAVDRAATALRRSHAVARELGAQPLLAEVEALSSRTRISLDAPARVEIDETSADHLGLTPREAEVLSLVAVGRTNRQIGEELYVSEKTASVHVSNILRKLGVSTRVDAAAVAQRIGMA